MGFDSIPFEEPELFTARSRLQAKDRLADRQDSTLHLELDSQDGLGKSLAEVGTEVRASCLLHCQRAKTAMFSVASSAASGHSGKE